MPSIHTYPLVLGCSVGILSAAAQSLGLTLQRKSHLVNDSKPLHLQKPAHRRGLWCIGVLLFLLANVVGSSVQITTLPLIVLSPLQAVGLVFNSLCAAWVLHEPLTRQSIAGTLLVAIGALIVAAWGVVSESSKPHNLDELLRLLHRPQFLLWMALSLAVVAIVLLTISSSFKPRPKYSEHLTSSKRTYEVCENQTTSELASRSSINTLNIPSSVKKSNPIPSNSCPSSSDSSVPNPGTLKAHLLTPKQLLVRGLLYAVVCGILSAHSLLMAKSAVEILVRCFVDGKTSDLYHYQSYLIVFAFLFFAVSQLFFMNRGLRLCSTAVLYPLVFCVYNATSILNSLIYFQQTQNMSLIQAIMVALGTLFILLGVLGLSWHLGWHDDLALERCKTNNNAVGTPGDNTFSLVDETAHSPRRLSLESFVGYDSSDATNNYNTFSTNSDATTTNRDMDHILIDPACAHDEISSAAVVTTAVASYPFGALEEAWQDGTLSRLQNSFKNDTIMDSNEYRDQAVQGENTERDTESTPLI